MGRGRAAAGRATRARSCGDVGVGGKKVPGQPQTEVCGRRPNGQQRAPECGWEERGVTGVRTSPLCATSRSGAWQPRAAGGRPVNLLDGCRSNCAISPGSSGSVERASPRTVAVIPSGIPWSSCRYCRRRAAGAACISDGLCELRESACECSTAQAQRARAGRIWHRREGARVRSNRSSAGVAPIWSAGRWAPRQPSAGTTRSGTRQHDARAASTRCFAVAHRCGAERWGLEKNAVHCQRRRELARRAGAG